MAEPESSATAEVGTENTAEGVRYLIDEVDTHVDIVLSLKRKNRWFCIARYDAGDGSPVRTLDNATVLDPGDGKQRSAFLSGLPADVPSELVKTLLMYASEHVAADTDGWQRWRDDGAAQRVAAILAQVEAQRVLERRLHLADMEADALERLRDPRLLFNIGEDITAWGLVGERANALTLELAVVSRVTDEPTSIVVKGESSGGKSYQVKAVLAFHPDDAHVDLTSMSEKGLIYDPRDYAHKMLCFYEVDGEASNPFAAYLLRTLLSEGRIEHLTVDTSSGMPAGTVITKEGPTAFVSTTIEPSLESQQETRTLSLLADDSGDQTRRVLARQALEAEGGAPVVDASVWQHMHEWLAATGATQVTIPFASRLPSHMPLRLTRVRRDFRRLLYLVKASALLHQHQRMITAEGVVVAELGDYAMAREVVTEAMGRSMLGLSEKTLSLVAKTIELYRNKRAEAQTQAGPGSAPSKTPDTLVFVTYQDLIKATGWPRTTIQRWLRPAVELGALENLNAGQSGRQAQLTPGSYVVDTAMVLPVVEVLASADEEVTWVSPMDGSRQTVAGRGERPQAEPAHLPTERGEGNYFSPDEAPEGADVPKEAEMTPPSKKIIISPPTGGLVGRLAEDVTNPPPPSSNVTERDTSAGVSANGQVVGTPGQVPRVRAREEANPPNLPTTCPPPAHADDSRTRAREGSAEDGGESTPSALLPWAPLGKVWEVVPENTIQPPGLEYRLGMGVDGQRYARWPSHAADTRVITDDAIEHHLREILADGPVPTGRAASELRHRVGRVRDRDLDAARDRLGVTTRHVRANGADADAWLWSLP